MILKIAKTELRNLFYSPIAWFLLIVFMVQCALVYFGIVDRNAQAQEMGGRSLEAMKDLTMNIFTGKSGLFASVMQNLYLYIPLLTMGLISREINAGTIKLLYSSPVTVTQIVLGKYVSMLIYSFLLLLIISVFVILGFWNVVALDYGMLLTGLLGFFLLLCAYSAIGLFMSSLTNYQVVAAIGTFVVIGFLSYVGSLWQNIDFVRDITYFLSLSGRTDHLLSGLIISKDIIYFIIVVFIFITLTILHLKSTRESKSFTIRFSRYAAVIVAALLLGYVTSRTPLLAYFDATKNQTQTLTPAAQRIIKELGKDKLEVIAYTNLMEMYGFIGSPEATNTYLSVWEPYTRFKPDISFKSVRYYDSIPDMSNLKSQYQGKNITEMAKMQAKNLRVDFSLYTTPENIRKQINLKPEGNRFVMLLKYRNRSTFLRVFDDAMIFPSEREVSAAFKRLLNSKIPKLAFVTGNFEREIEHKGDRNINILTKVATFRSSLVNQGFDVENIDLNKIEIPSGVTTLVIADPKVAFTKVALNRLQTYIDGGGNLLIAGEPGKQDVLNPIISQFGVQLSSGTLVQPDLNHAPNLLLAEMTQQSSTFFKPLEENFQKKVPITMLGATAIEYTSNSNYAISPLLFTDPGKSWKTLGKVVVDSAAIVFSQRSGDVKKAYPTAVAITRNVNHKNQRIVVTGDADFLSDAELSRWNIQNSNFLFSTGIFSWLNNGEYPIDTERPKSLDNRMKVSTNQVAFQKIVFAWVIPAILAAMGAILLIRRKRR